MLREVWWNYYWSEESYCDLDVSGFGMQAV